MAPSAKERLLRSTALAYAIALIGSGLVICARFVPEGSFRSFYASIAFLCAVSAAGAFGGWKPGFLTTTLSGCGAALFLVRPYYSFRVSNTGDVLRIVGSVMAGVAISILCEALRRARARIEERQQQLQEALQQLQIVTESMSASIVHCSRDFKFVWVSKPYADWLGLPAEEISGRPLIDILGPEAFEQLRPRFDRVLEGKNVQFEEFVNFKRIGRRWINAAYTPTLDSNGKPGGWVAVVLDTTERRQVEEALRQSEERFRQLAENINEVFWMVDVSAGKVLYISPAYERIWGRSCESLYRQPMSFLDAVHPDDQESVQRAAFERPSREGPTDEEYRIVTPEGAVKWIRNRAFPVKDAAGQVFRLAGIAEDITEKKRVEEALRDADRRKDEFLATLAHELRNPLAPICNAVELIQSDPENPPAMQAACDVLQRQLAHLVRLIDDLLEISRITRGKLQLRKERLSLETAVNSAIEVTRPLIDAAGHELTISLPSEPIYLEADSTRLAQIFSNLLNNAAKYAEKSGHIWLIAQRHFGSVSVAVRDTGIGIASENLSHIFEMFSQVVPAIDRSQGGLGIGLALVRDLVELHGGTIEAHSDGPGQGSEFIVRLPLAKDLLSERSPNHSGQTVEPSPSISSSRILVVDDNRDTTATLALILERSGHRVHIANDGLEAVHAAAAFRPDVVLLDIGLPKMNGFEVAKRIRKQRTNENVALVAVTGWGQQEDRRRAMEAGFDHHLTKPVEMGTLMRLLASIVPAGGPPTT